VGTIAYSGGGTVVTIALNAVGNAQRLKLHLSGIQPGGGMADIPMNVLWGDVNGDGTANVLDQGQVRTRSGQAIDASTMAFDVNADGLLNTADFTAVRLYSGAALP
jgi:hypothetical protein